MLWLVAAMAVSNAPTNNRLEPAVVVQATASVRILSGVQLKLDAPTNAGAPPAHDSAITADGTRQPAHLIEFE